MASAQLVSTLMRNETFGKEFIRHRLDRGNAMQKKTQSQLCRIWVCIDPTETVMMKNAALYVLYAVLDKTGGFTKKAGVTKRSMAKGTVRSFYFDTKHKVSVIRTLNAFEGLFASVNQDKVVDFKNECLGVYA